MQSIYVGKLPVCYIHLFHVFHIGWSRRRIFQTPLITRKTVLCGSGLSTPFILTSKNCLFSFLCKHFSSKWYIVHTTKLRGMFFIPHDCNCIASYIDERKSVGDAKFWVQSSCHVRLIMQQSAFFIDFKL